MIITMMITIIITMLHHYCVAHANPAPNPPTNIIPTKIP